MKSTMQRAAVPSHRAARGPHAGAADPAAPLEALQRAAAAGDHDQVAALVKGTYDLGAYFSVCASDRVRCASPIMSSASPIMSS